MKLQFKQSDDLIFIDKPAGFSTHSPDLGKLGLCEIFEKELQSKLYVVQRLDKTTTGCIVFAKNPQTATELTELFQTRQVQKKYLLVTENKSAPEALECETPIEGRPAHTLFKKIKTAASGILWEATPRTGRVHQIRRHISELGFPILGDEVYSGKSFPHLCLHAEELQIPGQPLFQSPAPLFMQNLEFLSDPVLVAWLSEIDRRQRLYQFQSQSEECLRLIHRPELRLDQFGAQIWFYWYSESSPTEQDLNRCQFVADLLNKKWFLKKMQNRGEDPHGKTQWSSDDWQTSWSAQENGAKYAFYSDQGQSPGLFLDQRENRKTLLQISANQKVLNLFSYTCGFSLNAALGGALEVASVDLSGRFLEWGQENFNLNSLVASKYEFYKQEAQLFLKGALKRNRQFDLIICDPPSFGRHKDGVFRLDQDFAELLQLCWKCLAPQGRMLFSTNLEKWDQQELRARIQKTLKSVRIENGHQGWDYELPNEEQLMKSFWIYKT